MSLTSGHELNLPTEKGVAATDVIKQPIDGVGQLAHTAFGQFQDLGGEMATSSGITPQFTALSFDQNNPENQLAVSIADQQAGIIRAMTTGDLSTVRDMGSIAELEGHVGEEAVAEMAAEATGLVEGFIDGVGEAIESGAEQMNETVLTVGEHINDASLGTLAPPGGFGIAAEISSGIGGRE